MFKNKNIAFIITFVAALFCSVTSSASVLMQDLETGVSFDLTETLQQLSGIISIDAVIAVDVAQADGDEWLIVEGENTMVFLETASFTELFRIAEPDIRDLFNLNTGEGYCSVYHPQGSPSDLLLYYDSQYGDWYSIDLESGDFSPYSGLSLDEPFYCGFSYSSHYDIGLLARSSDKFWWYESLPSRTPVDLDLSQLFDANPQHVSEFELSTGNSVLQLLIAVTLGGTPGTPTPTPGPGTPTATPPAGNTDYSVVMINGYEYEDIWRVNATDYSVEENLVLTGAAPNQIVQHRGELFVVNSLSHSVTVYDPHSLSFKREISTGIPKSPFLMAFVDDDHFYVTQFFDNSVTKMNAHTGQIVAEIPMPDSLPTDPQESTQPRPEGIVVVGNTAYVACANLNNSYAAGGPGVIVKINTSTDQVTDWVESGGRCSVGVCYHERFPDWIWITNAGDYTSGTGYDQNGTIAILSISSGVVTDSIPVNDAPYEMAFGQDRAYYTSAADGLVGRLDLSSLSLLNPVELPNAGQGLNYVSGIEMGPDNRLWVVEFNHNMLYTLDIENNDELIRETSVGIGPDDLIIVEKP